MDALDKERVSVLIVDDEPSVGDALRIILEAKGYEVVLVHNGLEGIEQARRRRFRFIVVDLFLPDISGLQVIKDIHERQPAASIVFITGNPGPEVFAEARKLGAIAALAKPFPLAEILALISAALDHP